MKILGMNFGGSKPITETPIIINQDVNNTSKFEFGCNFDPNIILQNNSGRGYANFGFDNMYPEKLKSYRSGSSIHNAILRWKEQATVGKGYTIDTSKLKGMQLIEANQLTQLFDGENTLEDVLDSIAMNYWMYGAFYVKITWNDDFTKIIKREVINSDKIRFEFPDSNGNWNNFYYCWDWKQTGRYPIQKYPKYSITNKRDKVQIMYFGIESPTSQLYYLPTYFSAEKYLAIDNNIAEFQDANIRNSIQPSIVITMFKDPGSPEKKRQVAQDIEHNFKGMKNSGNAMILFSEKGYEPTFDVLPASQLDKQFTTLIDTAQRNIAQAHSCSPILFGFKTPGSLGASQEIPVAFELAKDNQIIPAQRDINKFINRLFKINGLDVNFKLIEPELIIPTTAA